jgi:hypothetical protein
MFLICVSSGSMATVSQILQQSVCRHPVLLFILTPAAYNELFPNFATSAPFREAHGFPRHEHSEHPEQPIECYPGHTSPPLSSSRPCPYCFSWLGCWPSVRDSCHGPSMIYCWSWLCCSFSLSWQCSYFASLTRCRGQVLS